MYELQQFGTPTAEVPIYDENYFLSQFGEKLCFQRPNSSYNIWVFWSSTDHSSSIPNDFKSTFAFSRIDEILCSYRKCSVKYKFNVEEDLGFPAHAFRQKLPLFTPDLRYFSRQEHPWWDCVSNSYLRDLYAFPVFDASGHCCTGIIECVAAPELFTLSRIEDFKRYFSWALNVESCFMGPCSLHIQSRARYEIEKALEVLLKNRELPLAITWEASRQCSDENSCQVLHATTATPPLNLSFIDLHLKTGQGVAGKAYLSCNPCFCSDITNFSFSDYPLAHHARIHKLAGSFAICLRSSHTGDDDYVLEFLLRRNETNGYPQTLLDSILATMKQHLPSFKLASGQKLGPGLSVDRVTAIQDVSIKASYGDSVIKFKLSPTSGMVNLEKEIAKRLRIKSFRILYWDEEGDKILLPSECDADLRLCFETSIRLGITPIRMLVELD